MAKLKKQFKEPTYIEIVKMVEIVDNWGETHNITDPNVIERTLLDSELWDDDMFFHDNNGVRYFIDDLVGEDVKVNNKIFRVTDNEALTETTLNFNKIFKLY